MANVRFGQGLIRVIVCMAWLGSNVAEANRGFGEVHVLTTVPSPGSPDGITVKHQRVYVAGPAKFGTIPFLCTSMRRQRSRAASALPVHA